MLKQPCLGDIDVQLDFKENDSVPLAPEETQDMFWGSAHQAVTTLGFCVTHRKSTYPCNIETRYFYYCTYIRDHTQLFAAVALKDLLERLNVQAEWCHRLHVWADCGPHFRGYMFLWNLRSMVSRFHLSEAILHFHTEHHGKGRCNGQFGLQRCWCERNAFHKGEGAHETKYIKQKNASRCPGCRGRQAGRQVWTMDRDPATEIRLQRSGYSLDRLAGWPASRKVRLAGFPK